MIVKKIEMNNFMGFKNKTIELPPGLIFLIGKNGSGKSTILDAILFGLYRKTMRPISSLNDIIKKGEDEASLTLTIEHNNVEYRIERYIKSKLIDIIYKNNEKAAEGVVNVTNYVKNNILGFDYDVLLRTIFIGQRDTIRVLDSREFYSIVDKIFNVNSISAIYKSLESFKNNVINEKKKWMSELYIRQNILKDLKDDEKRMKKLEKENIKLKEQLEKISNKINKLKNNSDKLKQNKRKYIEEISVLKMKRDLISQYTDYIPLLHRYNINKVKKYLKLLYEYDIDTIKYSLIKKYKLDSIEKYLLNMKKDIDMYNENNNIYNKYKYDVNMMEYLISITTKYNLQLSDIHNIINSNTVSSNTLKESMKRVYLDICEKINDNKSLVTNRDLSEHTANNYVDKTDIKSVKLFLSNRSISHIEDKDLEFMKSNSNKINRIIKEFGVLSNIQKTIDDYNKAKNIVNEYSDKIKLINTIYDKMYKFYSKLLSTKDLDINMSDYKYIIEHYNDLNKLVDIGRNVSRYFKNLTTFKKEVDNLSKYNIKISSLEDKIKDIDNKLDMLISLEREYNEIESNIKYNNNVIKNIKDVIERTNNKDRVDILENKVNTLNEKIEQMEIVLKALNDYAVELNNRIYGTIQSVVLEYLDIFNFNFTDIRFDANSILVKIDSNNYLPVLLLSNAQKASVGLALRMALSAISDSKYGFKILIMDEPTEGFDIERTNSLKRLLMKLHDNNIYEQIIIVSHNKDLIDSMPATIINLERQGEN